MSKVREMYHICDDCNGAGKFSECIDYDYEIHEVVRCDYCNGEGYIPVKLVTEDK
jgi:DnaJ-class molecular chaperone